MRFRKGYFGTRRECAAAYEPSGMFAHRVFCLSCHDRM